MAGPALAVVFSKATGALARALGIAGRLGSQNLARQPKRTSNTVNALVIGVFLVTLVTISGNSLKRWSVDSLNDLSTADFVLGTRTGRAARAGADRRGEARRGHGVRADAVVRDAAQRSARRHHVGRPGTVGRHRLHDLGGLRSTISGDGAAVSSFSRTPVKLGDTIAMTALDGRTIELPVRAILEPSLRYVPGGRHRRASPRSTRSTRARRCKPR
jgi:putative ABC transport system permease protein